MELRQLQFFLAVAEKLNFSRAADALYISQPALSYQIAELERELGVDLFIRNRRKVSLSPEGNVLLPLAAEALAAAERLREHARCDMITQEPGPVRIAFDQTEDHFECTGITTALANFSRQHPQLRLDMRQASYARCVEQLLEDELDLAFLLVRHNEKLEPGLVGQTVHQSRLMLIFKDDTDEINSCEEALARLDLLLVSGKPRGRSRILACLEPYNPRIRTVDSIPAAFTLTQAGLAAMTLPHIYYDNHHYPELKGVDIPGPGALVAHYSVWNKNVETSPTFVYIQEILDMLKK